MLPDCRAECERLPGPKGSHMVTSMDSFNYVDGELYCEEVPVARIAKATGTPAYIYSRATLEGHCHRTAEAFAELSPIICYSIKSCQNLSICRLLAELGAGFDVVSGGELYRAVQAGADPAKIVFAGVGKSDAEINEGLDAGIGLFNVESEAEMRTLIRIAGERGTPTRAALRVNPDVDPKTHRYTTTGKKETKFGVDLERARRFFDDYGRDDDVRLCGIHLHIGSPVNAVEPYIEAITKGLALIDELREAGFAVEVLDIGGGFGAHYRTDEAPPAIRYAEGIVPLLRGRDLQVILEPGRSISANAGILVAETQYVKHGGSKTFAIVDAGMNDLLRPTLYEAYHFIWPVRPADGLVPETRDASDTTPGTRPVDVVGPICETGDVFAQDRPLPEIQRGDLLAVFTTGAYGFVMASQYNSRPRPPEVLVEGGEFRVVRRRETYDDLIEAELL